MGRPVHATSAGARQTRGGRTRARTEQDANVQSFDPRALRAVHDLNPDLRLRC
ncbi:MAG: hypothetical protein IPM98_17760 [Lewinellaceae bacterium]|nr:hypothetical protein [Lewinellaceae bacterium]